MKKNFFSSSTGIIVVGAIIGLTAVFLQKMGNPGNMGVCVACFLRDVTGALGLHKAALVQYIRPEIPGFVLGSFLSALLFSEFKPRGGSSPLVRFMLGVFAMIGALVFLGCPWRALLRISAGDLNAVIGFLGLFTGVFAGTLFLRSGYTLGRSEKTSFPTGLIMPGLMVLLLAALFMNPQIADKESSGFIFYSLKGPGSMHAPLYFSIAAGLLIGFLAQRSRFCTVGAIRDLILFKQFHLFSGILSLVAAAFIFNLVIGKFNPGMSGQPIAHVDSLWNFLGMVLSGFAFCLAGGCPGRQLFLSGEGDGDAAVFSFGLITGAAFSHNFMLASSPDGLGKNGSTAVIAGLVFCLIIGLFMREKSTGGKNA
ncbi:MAG: YedE-related selenium metabolism membrane protein [Candidatus Riflebacteria bacterium]|nr:YedE-related selenium metabolism membrane protein [Candidatus Riflebacteria bacterium]